MWTYLPTWARLCIAFALFGIGGLILWSSMGPTYYGSRRRSAWRVGFAVIALGFVALIFSNKSTSEKKGYRF